LAEAILPVDLLPKPLWFNDGGREKIRNVAFLPCRRQITRLAPQNQSARAAPVDTCFGLVGLCRLVCEMIVQRPLALPTVVINARVDPFEVSLPSRVGFHVAQADTLGMAKRGALWRCGHGHRDRRAQHSGMLITNFFAWNTIGALVHVCGG